MHEPVATANSPEWRRAHLVSRALPCILDDAIASSNVVQRKIAERVDDLVAEGCRDRECSAIDQRARSGSGEGTSMAHVAADGVE